MLGDLSHLLNPQAYLMMIPPHIPLPGAMNLIIGAEEIAGGSSVLIPRLRRAAAWGLIVLLLTDFPANIHVALNGWENAMIPTWILWARLLLQFALVAWVYSTCLTARDTTRTVTDRTQNA
jgi:uncharacterized membrane protein